jgi:hypothetical protein
MSLNIQAEILNHSKTFEYPHVNYAFKKIHFISSDVQSITNRQTYSLLNFAGDVGGLYGAL